MKPATVEGSGIGNGEACQQITGRMLAALEKRTARHKSPTAADGTRPRTMTRREP